MLFTLVHRDKTLTCGIFRTPDAAESWALTHCPGIPLQAVEFMVSSDIEEFLTEAQIPDALVSQETGKC